MFSLYKKFQVYTPFCLYIQINKNGFADLKSFWGFRETGRSTYTLWFNFALGLFRFHLILKE